MTDHPRQPLVVALLAAALFVPLFIVRGIGAFDFWWWMSANITVLLVLTAAIDRRQLVALANDVLDRPATKIAVGLLAAAGLYAVFFIGNILARRILPFAGSDISQVYGFKTGASTLRVIFLMALVIGPGEELFWRGYLQRNFQDRFGGLAGFLAATALYTLVHAGSGNPMLVLAAAVCGLFWGYLYLKTKSVLLVLISHTVWDLAVFILFPFA
jgi:membrane protease YdiL (CAAX protease family)